MVALLTSGLTASVALEQAGQMGRGQIVLVTAAAGGTGLFAVQLAKLAGNTVVGTCSGPEKARQGSRGRCPLRGEGARECVRGFPIPAAEL